MFLKINLILVSFCFLITGCSTGGGTYYNPSSSISYYSSSKLKTIDSDTFRDIFDDNQSGVYKNPYGLDEIVTLQFLFDKHYEEKISLDLSYIGLNPSIFKFKDRTKDIPQDAFNGTMNLSFHSPSPYSTDDIISLTVLEDTNIRYGLISPYVYSNNEKLKDYDEYFILMHEISHGFDYQSYGLMKSFMSILNHSDIAIRHENGSDFAALIKTIQLMKKEGVSENEILFFINTGMEQRVLNGYNEKRIEDHFTSPVFDIVRKSFLKNPNLIYSMKNKDIVLASEIVSLIVLEHDYSKDLVYAFNSNESLLKQEIEHYGKIVYGDNYDRGKLSTVFSTYVKLSNSVKINSHESQRFISRLGVIDFPYLSQKVTSSLNEKGINF